MALRRKAGIKKLRQDKKRHLRNLAVLSELKTLGREFLQLLTQKKKEEALKFFRKLASKLDTAKKKRIIHAKKASRQKSRLAKAMAKAFKS